MSNTNTTETTGAKALTFINEAISKKLTVYVSSMTHATKVSPATVKTWSKSGNTLFKPAEDGGLLMASGKNFVRIATPTMMLVGLTAH